MVSTSDVTHQNKLATASFVLASTPIFATAVCSLVTYGAPYTEDFWNPFVIAAGVAALSSLAAIITGAVSLRQIKKQGGRGKNLAIAGITVGVLTIGTILVPVLLMRLASMGFFGVKPL